MTIMITGSKIIYQSLKIGDHRSIHGAGIWLEVKCLSFIGGLGTFALCCKTRSDVAA